MTHVTLLSCLHLYSYNFLCKLNTNCCHYICDIFDEKLLYTFSYNYVIICSSFITCSSFQISAPETVTKRFYHSMSTYYISEACAWIIVTGGYREHNRSNNTDLPVSGCDAIVIMELGMIIITHKNN